MKRFVGALVVAAALAAGPPAMAGPPFLTDDPVPVDFGHFEAYVFNSGDQAGGITTSSWPAFEFNAGILNNVQFHLVAPFTNVSGPGMPSVSGFGDMELGLKVRFVQETPSLPQIGFFPMAEIPTGNAGTGLGNGRTWFRLPIWAQKSWGHWTTYGGGGVALNSAPGMLNYGFGGLLIQRDLSEKLTLGGEIFTQGAGGVGAAGYTVYNLGGYYNFTPQLSLLFSVGHSFAGESHAIHYVGMYYTFPKAAAAAGDDSKP